MKLLSVIIPCYNSQDYMKNCIESLLPGGEDVELIIVNDGSSDFTGLIAEQYAASYPGIVRVIQQENGGHGAAINAGISLASGLYVKVVDSDDWVDYYAYKKVLTTLQEMVSEEKTVDMLVCNFVYEKDGGHRLAVMHYDKFFPKNRIFTWDEVKRYRKGQYLLMHSVIYRLDVMRREHFQLPHKTFYVDNLYVFLPMIHVKTIYYLDVNFYRYYIGRAGQSVNENIMISRIDQQIKVNKLMVDMVDFSQISNRKQREIMLNYLEIITIISSALLIKSGDNENLLKKNELWNYIKRKDRKLYYQLRTGIMGTTMNLPGRVGRKVSVAAYIISQKVVGFN